MPKDWSLRTLERIARSYWGDAGGFAYLAYRWANRKLYYSGIPVPLFQWALVPSVPEAWRKSRDIFDFAFTTLPGGTFARRAANSHDLGWDSSPPGVSLLRRTGLSRTASASEELPRLGADHFHSHPRLVLPLHPLRSCLRSHRLRPPAIQLKAPGHHPASVNLGRWNGSCPEILERMGWHTVRYRLCPGCDHPRTSPCVPQCQRRGDEA